MTINYQPPYGQTPYTNNPYFSQPNAQPGAPGFPVPPLSFFEQSYIENILRLNAGKMATVYMSFEGSQWGSKVFKGEILEAGKDHIVLKDPTSGINYLLLSIYLSYVSFEEDITYEYPFD